MDGSVVWVNAENGRAAQAYRGGSSDASKHGSMVRRLTVGNDGRGMVYGIGETRLCSRCFPPEGFLTMDRGQLVDRVHHVLRSGDLDIDPVCHMLHRGGKRINASPKACRLIFCLVQNCERAVSKEELAEVIWPGINVAETSLRWLLKEVRRCLGDDGTTQRYIETVRGYGLRWGPSVSLVACCRARMVVAADSLPAPNTKLHGLPWKVAQLATENPPEPPAYWATTDTR